MKRLSIMCALFGTLLTVHAAHAQGYYGPRYGRPGFGPPGYGGGWYGMAGCGLGSLVFGPVDTPFAQILAATTNATFATQTFGITSGTSNCVSGGVVRAEREQAAFAEVNFQDLKRDMAAGGGPFFDSFATLLGCRSTAKPTLGKKIQARYESILPSDTTSPMELIANVKAEIASDPSLAAGCSDERAIARAEGKNAEPLPRSPAPKHGDEQARRDTAGPLIRHLEYAATANDGASLR
jgi:hypothetical protein